MDRHCRDRETADQKVFCLGRLSYQALLPKKQTLKGIGFQVEGFEVAFAWLILEENRLE